MLLHEILQKDMNQIQEYLNAQELKNQSKTNQIQQNEDASDHLVSGVRGLQREIRGMESVSKPHSDRKPEYK